MNKDNAPVVLSVIEVLKKNNISVNEETVILGSYLMKYISEHSTLSDWDEVYDSDSIPDTVKELIKVKLGSVSIIDFIEPADKLSKKDVEDLTDFIISNNGYEMMSRSGDIGTPISIVKLVDRILEINDSDFVGDFCCGYGNFIINEAQWHRESHFFGMEINRDAEAIAEIRSEMIGAFCEIKPYDVFSVLNYFNNPFCFNKIFSNYPFGMPIKMVDPDNYLKQEFLENINADSHYRSSDWLFNYLMVKVLVPEGKAVGIMTNGSTWNKMDRAARKYFVENGMIEAVISLPPRLFSFSSIATSLIILSNNNTSVKLIDATDYCIKGRRNNELSEENIDDIIGMLKNNTGYTMVLTADELSKNDYILNYSRYAGLDQKEEAGVPFENVINNVTRGARLTAAELDTIASTEPTPYQYLMLGNIHDGMIDEGLPYITEIDKKNKKYCLNNRSLVLSKNGYPYKVAVAETIGDVSIIANGNLYIIDLDESKADPYYIKAYFESEQGILALNSISVGAAIPSIGIDQLKQIHIPLPPLNTQKQIAKRYKEYLYEIKKLKKSLKEVIDKMHHVLDDIES